MGIQSEVKELNAFALTDKDYKRTSQRMAEGIWQAYLRRHPNRLSETDLVFRLRIAHMLLLQFNRVFFHPDHSEPTIFSQNELVTNVLNFNNLNVWTVVGDS